MAPAVANTSARATSTARALGSKGLNNIIPSTYKIGQTYAWLPHTK